MTIPTRACMWVHSAVQPNLMCNCMVCILVHIYDCMFLCLSVYIMQALTAIGGGSGSIGVFALAAVQHSTFLCDIQYCDLRKPALQRSSLSTASPSFFLSCYLPTFLSVSLIPSVLLYHLLHPLFISEHGKSSVIPEPQLDSLFKSFSSTVLHFF